MSRDIEPGVRIEGLVFERELGRGAFASVWLARDALLERPVAVKVLRPPPGGPALGDGRRVLAEARLVGRLKSPHIVTLHRVHRLPDDEGWMIEMEYVEGGSLEELLVDRVPLPIARAREILRGTCTALSVAHAAGVVHGDVKPANVLLGRGGDVKLADFGLASFLGDTSLALSFQGRVAGTPSYMAPEVVMGERATPASDLWSAGVMLYRMLAGRLPFEGPTMDALFFQIHHATPRDLPGEVPEALARAAMRCLSRRPQDRPASADEILATLAGPARVAEPRIAASARAAPAAARLFGRDGEVAKLTSLLDSAAAGASSVVLITGDAGVGKTALLREAATLAGRRGFHVLEAAATPSAGLVSPLLAAARIAVEGSGSRDPVVDPGELGAGETAIRRVLSESDDARPADRQSAAWAVEQIVRAVARRSPVAILADDAQHADGKDVRLFKDLTAQLAGARVLVVLACRQHVERGGGETETSGLHELLALGGAVRVELAALPAEDCYRVIAASMPGKHIASNVAVRVLDVAEGNPLLALELMRHLVETGAAVVRGDVLEAGPDWRSADLPRRFHDLVALRLSHVSDEDRALLDVAAVDGLNFDGEAIAAVVERPLLVLLRQLQTLHRHRGLITPRPSGYRFAHPVLQEVIYRDLAPDLRRELHRRLAEDLELRERSSPVDPERLGQHWERAGLRERAAPYLERAALHAARVQEYLRAIDLATRSGLLPDGIDAETVQPRAELLFRLCGCWCDLGRADRAEEILARVQAAAEARDDEQLLLRAAVCREDVRFHVGGADAVDQAALVRASAQLTPCEELGTAQYVLGSVRKLRGDLAEATQHLVRASEVFAALGLSSSQTRTRHQLASVALRDGRLREAETLYAETTTELRAAGRRTDAAISEVNRVHAAFQRGSLDGLAASLERSVRALQLSGAGNHASQSMVVLSQVRYAVGDAAGAEQAAADALALAMRTGFASGAAEARLELGQLAALRGALDVADAELSRALAGAAGDPETVARAMAAQVRRAAFAADREAAQTRAHDCIAAARGINLPVVRSALVLSLAVSALYGLPSRGLDGAEDLLQGLAPGENPVTALAPAVLAAARAFRRADGDAAVIRRAALLLRERPCGPDQTELRVVAGLLDADALRREGRHAAAAALAEDPLRAAAALGHAWLEATLLRLLVHVEPRGDHAPRLDALIGRVAASLANEADRTRVAVAWEPAPMNAPRPPDAGRDARQ